MGGRRRQGAFSTDTSRPLITSTQKDAIILDHDTNVNELNSEKETEEPVRELLHQESEVPLFLRDSSEGQKGDAQDEKDKTEE
jgi:hypothetical protein